MDGKDIFILKIWIIDMGLINISYRCITVLFFMKNLKDYEVFHNKMQADTPPNKIDELKQISVIESRIKDLLKSGC